MFTYDYISYEDVRIRVYEYLLCTCRKTYDSDYKYSDNGFERYDDPVNVMHSALKSVPTFSTRMKPDVTSIIIL